MRLQCPEAILFDVDGTLVDSEAVHIAAFNRLLEKHGLSIDPRPFLGRSTGEAIQRLFPEASSEEQRRLAHEKRILTTKLLNEAENLLKSGAIDLLTELSAQFRLGLCSSGSRRTVEIATRRGLPTQLCEVVITAEDCVDSKPHPEPYEKSLELLGLRQHQVVAVEDTLIGASSARAAGLLCILVGNGWDPATLPAGTEAVENLRAVGMLLESCCNAS